MSGFRFTTSWDDGHPLDIRIAELLSRYGLSGTFYVPGRNTEGREVMSPSQLRELDREFEIGSHTRDHCYLRSVSDDVARDQIRSGKSALEDTLGHSVPGFAYPGGQHSRSIRRAVAEAGFAYARTTQNFRLDMPEDRFLVPTTLQIYPHSRMTYVRNLIGRRNRTARTRMFMRAISKPDINSLMRDALHLAQKSRGICHLWGHSWEIDELDMWQPLEQFFAFVQAAAAKESIVDNAGLTTGS